MKWRNAPVRSIVKVDMVTRREALQSAAWTLLSAPLLGADSKGFWNSEDPAQWTAAEKKELLTNSPWARPANIGYHPAPGPLGGQFGIYGLGSGPAGAGDNPKTGSFRAVVLWESAAPVQAVKHDADASQFYILSLSGDIPAPSADAGDAEIAQREQMLKEFTKLERKGGSTLYLDHISAGAAATLFYFSRSEPITSSNREVTFITKMGPLDIKAKFPLGEMTYHGKLEL